MNHKLCKLLSLNRDWQQLFSNGCLSRIWSAKWSVCYQLNLDLMLEWMNVQLMFTAHSVLFQLWNTQGKSHVSQVSVHESWEGNTWSSILVYCSTIRLLIRLGAGALLLLVGCEIIMRFQSTSKKVEREETKLSNNKKDKEYKRRKPKFIIIGGKKCGTGTLRAFLTMHSKIKPPG